MIAGLHASKESLAALCELGMPLTASVINAAAQSGLVGRLHMLQHLIISGSINMLNWLKLEIVCALEISTCLGAAQAGHMAVLKHLRNEGCDWDNEYITCDAAVSGSI